MSLANAYLDSAIKRLSYYKSLADKTFEQLNDDDLHFKPDEDSNSIAIIVQHMAGNMLSRWTDFLITDGEKEWRNRDVEFEEQNLTKTALLAYWQKGWDSCLNTIHSLTEADLLNTITIRGEALSVVDAINRQLAHYPYHIGQLIYIAKTIKKTAWQNLSIPKGNSQQYNQQLDAKR